MIVALQIGKGTSIGVPGKNLRLTMGRPIMEYPLMAASKCDLIDRIFVSTDSKEIADIGGKYGATQIDRPPELAKPDTLTESVLQHALSVIRQEIGEEPELIAVMFCNVATTTPESLRQAINILRADKQMELDSVFSVAEFNMFAPMRARKLNPSGIIEPYVDLSLFSGGISSIRDQNETCYFADFGVQVVRPRCIDNIWAGMPPVRWMGHKSHGLVTDYGFDIDKVWQFPAIEYWLSIHGFSETSTPYDTEDR